MNERTFAIQQFKKITMLQRTLSEEKLHRYDVETKRFLSDYGKLMSESRLTIKELEQECKEAVNEELGYAMDYLNRYDFRLDVVKLHGEMSHLILIAGLTDIIRKTLLLVKYYAPNGLMASKIIDICYCRDSRLLEEEILSELGVSRSSFFREKRRAVAYFGCFLRNVVVPQLKDERFKPVFLEDDVH